MTEVGRLNVRLNLDSTQFNQNMRTAQQRIQNASQRVGRFGDTMTRRVTMPLMAVGAAIGGLIINAGNFADELLDLAAVTGISTDELQLWRRAAVDAGTDADAFADGVEYLNRRMQEGGEFAAGFERGAERLGVELYDAEGAARATGDAVTDMILALADIEDPIERAAIGAEAFERRWEQIAPLVGLGREELEKILDMEPVFSEEELQKLDEARKMWDRIKYEIGQAGIQIALALVEHQDFEQFMEETFKPALDGIVESVGNLIQAWNDLDEGTQRLYGNLVLVALAIGPASKLLQGVGILIGFLSGPFGLVALVFAAAEAFSRWADEAARASDAIPDWIAELAQFVGPVTRFRGMIAAAREDIEWLTVRIGDAIDALRDLGEWLGNTWDRVTSFDIGGLAQGLIPSFDTGGIVPGPRGMPQLAVVHGGETVLPTHKEGYGGTTINMTNNFTVTDKPTADYARDQIVRALQSRGLAGAYR